MFKHLSEDIDAVMERDPAARSRIEVIFLYPGFHAVVLYRLAHSVWKRGWRFLGRAISQFARFMTGIEIHPGARIGRRFFIDHGMGVVIGETAEIGNNVTLYHGVTLGGISPAVDSSSQVNVKRHPTLEDDVIIGSGAQVLGPITVGKCARVGANAVVVKDIPCGATAVGIPARAAKPIKPHEEGEFAAYGIEGGELPDPLARIVDALLDKVQSLSMRVQELEEGRTQGSVTSLPLEGEGEEVSASRDECAGSKN